MKIYLEISLINCLYYLRDHSIQVTPIRSKLFMKFITFQKSQLE